MMAGALAYLVALVALVLWHRRLAQLVWAGSLVTVWWLVEHGNTDGGVELFVFGLAVVAVFVLFWTLAIQGAIEFLDELPRKLNPPRPSLLHSHGSWQHVHEGADVPHTHPGDRLDVIIPVQPPIDQRRRR
jgi:hypothetical protein